MSQIAAAAGDGNPLGWLLAAMTVVFFAVFAAWTLWAWWPSRRTAMEAAAQLPLEGDDE